MVGALGFDLVEVLDGLATGLDDGRDHAGPFGLADVVVGIADVDRALGRDGEGVQRQEVVICWNAENGEELWQWRSTPHNTFVPWQRLGWASLAGDSETGYLYAHTSDGVLIALKQ